MKWSFLLLYLLFLKSCINEEKIFDKLIIESKSRTYKIGDTLSFSIKSIVDYDSIKFFIDNTIIKSPYVFENNILGDKKLIVNLFRDGKKYSLSESVRLLSSSQPTLYSYKILNEFPHDIEAYTQGFEFYKGKLYESTGINGKSSLREVNFKTGVITRIKKIDKQYFSEGISIINDSIYQLTWMNNIGFIYDLKNFNLIRSFDYQNSKEGWGLCNDGKNLYKSDGSEKIWKLDLSTLNELSYIQATTNKTILKKLNELEWVNGKIYANTYQFQKEVVVIIDPLSGKVEGVIDFSGLKQKVDQIESLNVLNGIAYNSTRNSFFITGKNWSKVFEVQIIQK